MSSFLKLISLTLLSFIVCSCVNPDGTYYPSSGGYDPYYYENERERDRIERERERLERERWEFERQRESERQRPVYNPPRYPAPPPPASRPPQQERCPAGFSPSENKCSPQERQRGCKDIRLPGGLGCVKR